MGQPVVHFEVMGNDAAALRSFYSDLFGWKINVDENLQYGMIDPADNPPGGSESSGIGGGIGEMPEGQPGYATFYVDVPDVEAALAKAEGLGGTRVMGPETVMEGLVIGLFTDPEGHIIGVAASGTLSRTRATRRTNGRAAPGRPTPARRRGRPGPGCRVGRVGRAARARFRTRRGTRPSTPT